MARDIKGMSLAQAYVVLKSLGISIRVLSLDNEHMSGFGLEDNQSSRIDVDVCNGVVKRAWVK